MQEIKGYKNKRSDLLRQVFIQELGDNSAPLPSVCPRFQSVDKALLEMYPVVQLLHLV